MKNGCCRSNIPGECQFAAPRRLYAGCRQVAAIVAFTVRQMAHTMHGPGRCPGIAQQRFAGLETGYRFSRATGRPHQSGPRGSARGVARKPRTIHSMTPDTVGMRRCGAAGIAGEKPSECGPLVFKHPVSDAGLSGALG